MGCSAKSSTACYKWFSLVWHQLYKNLDISFEGLILGRYFIALDKLAVAERLCQKALKEVEGGNDPTVEAKAFKRLGMIYAKQQNHSLARKIYQKALEGYESLFERDADMTLEICSLLGGACEQLGEIENAEELYMRAPRGLEARYDANHERVLLQPIVQRVGTDPGLTRPEGVSYHSHQPHVF